MVKKIIYSENAALLLLCLVYYFSQGFPLWLLLVLLFVPDLAIVFYAINPRIGQLVYNGWHTYLWPLLLLSCAWWLKETLYLQLALIWTIHIAMDRTLGFGLKYTEFKETYLQKL